MVKTIRKREDYALKRMSFAIERILGEGSTEEKAQAVLWIAAWKACHAAHLAAHKLRTLSGGGGGYYQKMPAKPRQSCGRAIFLSKNNLQSAGRLTPRKIAPQSHCA